MPIPFILAGAAGIAGATGIVKGAKSLINNSDAKSIVAAAQEMYDEKKKSLELQRKETTKCLEDLGELKLHAWAEDMNVFVETFNSFKNVQLEGTIDINERLKMKISNPENMKNIEVGTVTAKEVTQAGIASLGAGALAGIASYGGAMMFASASTGTAIATLSGVAAKNATLAWFGGGALKAGGLGMAGGSAVLGGIVAGPVLAVAGFIMEAKSEENLANARKTYAEAENAVEQMGIMIDFMGTVSQLSTDYYSFISQYQKLFRPVLNELQNIKERAFQRQLNATKNPIRRITFMFDKKIDFDILTGEEQKVLHLSWLMAQVLYSILVSPILTEKGEVDTNAVNTLSDAEDAVITIEETKTSLLIPAEEEQLIVVPSTSKMQSTGLTITAKTPVDKNANNVLWKLLNLFATAMTTIVAVWYCVSGILLIIGGEFKLGILSAILFLSFWPFYKKRKELSYKERGKNSLFHCAIGIVAECILELFF